MSTLSKSRIPEWNKTLKDASPQQIVEWAVAIFGDKLTLASSFSGVSGAALLDMAVKIDPTIRVFYLDTDFLFPETYNTRDMAIRRYGITPLGFRPKRTPEEQAADHGEALWKTNPDLCCSLRKVEPNGRALEGMEAWIAGLRRDQSQSRSKVEPVQWDAKFGLYKLAPLWNWTEDDVWDYIGQNRIPVNPLLADGYSSIGCTNCTRRVAAGEDLRGGRWSGVDKIECGLHTK